MRSKSLENKWNGTIIRGRENKKKKRQILILRSNSTNALRRCSGALTQTRQSNSTILRGIINTKLNRLHFAFNLFLFTFRLTLSSRAAKESFRHCFKLAFHFCAARAAAEQLEAGSPATDRAARWLRSCSAIECRAERNRFEQERGRI